MKRKTTLLTLLAASALLAACGPSGTSGTTAQTPSSTDESTNTATTPEETSSSTSTTVNRSIEIVTEPTSIFVTKTLQLEVNAENGTVAYSVEGEAASVSETGLVTGLAAGKATVKAYLVEDETVFDTIELDVVDTILDTAVNPTVWDYEGL